MLDLARQHSERFDVHVVAPSVPGAPRREGIDRVTVHRFRYFPRRWETLADGAIMENLRQHPVRLLQVVPFLLAQALTTALIVRRVRPVAIHAHWLIPQGLVARLVARKEPQLVTVHGGDLYGLTAAPFRWLKRWVIDGADAVTVVNRDMVDRLREMGARLDHVSVISMGADVTAIRDAARGATRTESTFLFVGRLVEKKGLRVLLEALELLSDLDWTCDVIGDGPLRSALEQRSERLGKRVRFHGALPRAEVARAYVNASALVLPSVAAASGDQDGLPVVLMEGMAAGCPIVASRLPGIDEALDDGKSGLLVPPGDPAALAAALRQLLRDADLRDTLARGAQAAAGDYTAEAVGERYCSLLEHVATSSPARREASRSGLGDGTS